MILVGLIGETLKTSVGVGDTVGVGVGVGGLIGEEVEAKLGLEGNSDIGETCEEGENLEHFELYGYEREKGK